MRSISLDEAQLATLTPEEQAAITGDDFTEDEVKAIQGGPATDDADDDGDDGDADEVVDADGKPVVVEKPADAPASPADAAATAIEPEPADAPPVRHEYVAKMPQDYDQKIADLATKEAEIRARFKDGGVPIEDYEEQRDAIIKEREGLNTARVKAEISQEMREQATQNEWHNQIKSFMEITAKSVGIDYRKDDVKSADLDLFVKTLAQSPANADKSGEWFLAEAHKRVMALHGLAPAPKTEGTKPPASRKPPLDAAPKTLAQVPGGDGPGDVSDEFAQLDSLDGNDLEAAISKMTPAQREKFALGR